MLQKYSLSWESCPVTGVGEGELLSFLSLERILPFAVFQRTVVFRRSSPTHYRSKSNDPSLRGTQNHGGKLEYWHKCFTEYHICILCHERVVCCSGDHIGGLEERFFKSSLTQIHTHRRHKHLAFTSQALWQLWMALLSSPPSVEVYTFSKSMVWFRHWMNKKVQGFINHQQFGTVNRTTLNNMLLFHIT